MTLFSWRTISCLLFFMAIDGEVQTAEASNKSIGKFDCISSEEFYWQHEETKWVKWNYDPTGKRPFKFTIEMLESKDEFIAKVNEEGNILQISGSNNALQIAPNQFSFVVAASPCTFTEIACLALVTVDITQEKPHFAIALSGSVISDVDKQRNLVLPSMVGSCKVSK